MAMAMLQIDRVVVYDEMAVMPSVGWLFALALLLGVGLWLLVARSSLVRGGDMERPERVPQLYGYSVCLIAIVVILVSVSSIVNRLFVLSDPLASGGAYGWGGGPVLTSFESYRATMDRAAAPLPPGATAPPAPTEAELRARYEALRADQLVRVRLDARRDLTGSTLLLLIALVLFWWHWGWVRRLQASAHGPSTGS